MQVAEIATKKDLEDLRKDLQEMKDLLRESQSQTGERKPGSLLRLPDVLARIPVSKTAWWNGVKAGHFPDPVPLGCNTKAWRESDIERLVKEGVSRKD